MNANELFFPAMFAVNPGTLAGKPAIPPGRLGLVSAHEEASLRRDLARGHLPPDLESKLLKLSAGSLLHRSVEQNCRLFVAILQAAYAGQFPEAGADDCARLLRVLAYVRKWDDEIPDYRPDGFVDDQEEVRAAANQLADLIRKFKAWRLRHQVPAMWKLGHIA